MLMLIPTFLFGQATERLTNKRTNETYYVLKSDTTIRNGSYKNGHGPENLILRGIIKME